MKKQLHRSILLVLCLSVLTGSVGMALPERFCRMLGISARPAFSEKMSEGCCTAKKSSTPVTDYDCCDLEVTHQKLQPVSGLHFPTFAFAALPPALLASWDHPLFILDRQFQEPLQFTDSSPPLYGRDLLCAIHVLLI